MGEAGIDTWFAVLGMELVGMELGCSMCEGLVE